MTSTSADPSHPGPSASVVVPQPQDVGVTLEGRHVALFPVGPQHYEILRALELSEDLVPRWRHEGATPSPEEWARGLWNGVLAQFLVLEAGAKTPSGLVCAYKADFRHGFAYLAAAKFEQRRPSPLFIAGIGLFIDYLFACWNFRKLYVETNELSLGQFGSGLDWLFVEEGRLRGHRYFAGRWWDQFYLALYRERWDQVAPSLRRFF